MIYIYDILLNWQDEYVLDFFEWEETDNIEHIKKMPLLKVSEETLNNVYNNIVKIKDDTLKIIYKKSEAYKSDKIALLDYNVILTDEKRVVALEFDQNGKVIAKSSLLLEEENEVLTIASSLEYYLLEYEINNYLPSNDYLTKEEKKIKRYLYNEFNATNDVNKLKYLYNEVFDDLKEENIKEKLLNSLNLINNKHKKLFYLLEKCSFQ